MTKKTWLKIVLAITIPVWLVPFMLYGVVTLGFEIILKLVSDIVNALEAK